MVGVPSVSVIVIVIGLVGVVIFLVTKKKTWREKGESETQGHAMTYIQIKLFKMLMKPLKVIKGAMSRYFEVF